MVAVAHIHPVALRGAHALGGGSRPQLLDRTDATFMATVREQLGDPGRWPQLRDTLTTVRAPDKAFKLYQPIHRTSHLLVLEAFCDDLGKPRLDPAKIESSGLVIRRLLSEGGRTFEQAWMSSDDGERSWIKLENDEQTHLDPDPKRRRQAGGNSVHLDTLRALRKAQPPRPLTESTEPLFVLPPRVCQGAGATLLYGLVPTASLDTTALPVEGTLPDRDDLLGGDTPYPERLQEGGKRDVPHPGQRVSGGSLRSDAGVIEYAGFVSRVVAMFGLLDQGSKGAASLRARFKKLVVEYPDKKTGNALDHLQAAANVLVYGRGGDVLMPLAWPAISKQLAGDLADAAAQSVRERYQALGRGLNRFAGRDELYVLRAFIRVRRDDGCPPQLVWSEPSEKFHIAPWFDPGNAPVTVIELPDPTRDKLATLKPNIAFQVPPMLAGVLRKNTPKKLLDGEGSDDPSSKWGQICAFSIPIITICAFIVLQIFLVLFNIIFFWLPFIKICFPVKK
jgi:hypothetical protein